MPNSSILAILAIGGGLATLCLRWYTPGMSEASVGVYALVSISAVYVFHVSDNLSAWHSDGLSPNDAKLGGQLGVIMAIAGAALSNTNHGRHNRYRQFAWHAI